MFGSFLRVAGVLILLAGSLPAGAARADSGPSGTNVIFLHPDGTALNSWNAARTYWSGPDSALAWDRMPFMAVYRGHSADLVGATSNGGATAHAFGHRVVGAGSYGRDGARERARPILARSGYPGSILREAANAGHPTGVVNDGDLAEPGSGAFFAEASGREDALEIVRQLLDGRPGYEGVDRPLVVALGGGERFFLPAGTPACGDTITADCAVHADVLNGATASRTDGRNLVREAIDRGWVVVRTRVEFDGLVARVSKDASYAPRVLGLFAADDVFNDAPEEALLARGLVHARKGADPREGRLLLWGSPEGTHGFDPPTPAEMHALALTILARHAQRSQKPFLLVTEVESTDNFANQNNAIAMLVALRRTDEVIARTLAHVERAPRTFVLIAADSDASGMQLVDGAPAVVQVNPTGTSEHVQVVQTDGIEGRGSAAFVSAPDADGVTHPFTVAWFGTPDAHGGVLARAAGRHAEWLHTRHSVRFRSEDVYGLMWSALFGKELTGSPGVRARTRSSE